MSVNLDEIRTRAADEKRLDGHEATQDRRALLALVDELLNLTRRLAEEAHAIDYEQGDRCLDDCPGCDADELLDVLEGDQR